MFPSIVVTLRTPACDVANKGLTSHWSLPKVIGDKIRTQDGRAVAVSTKRKVKAQTYVSPTRRSVLSFSRRSNEKDHSPADPLFLFWKIA